MNLKNHLKLTAFHVMWLVVGMVSLIDLILAIWFLDPSNMNELRATEHNPMVIRLVELSGDMSLFVLCKIMGTVIALLIVKKIFHHSEKWGLSIVGGVFAFQLWLLYYLLYGT